MPLADLPVEVQILASTIGLQILLPVALLAALAIARPGGRLSWFAATAVVASYAVALGVIGQFGVPLPWYAPYVYALLVVAAAVRSWQRCRPAAARGAVLRGLWSGLRLTLALALAGLSALALSGYRPPGDAPSVALRFPLSDGVYYISAGGNNLLINHHLVTLNNDFRRDYRGQSYGVDIVRVNRLGVSAVGLLPENAEAYSIFGQPVLAPCNGRVTRRRDGVPDMPPPRRNLASPLGNHVFIACKGVEVVLAHLQNASVEVDEGEHVTIGQSLGRVGNSGQSTAPHLHIHAQQRDGHPYAPLRADPVPIRFDGRYLVRNSLVWRP